MLSKSLRAFAPLLAGATLALGLGVTAAPPAAAATPPPSDTAYGEARILWLLNQERRVRGLPPVTRNAGADHIAQYSANVQAWYGRLGHNPNLGRDITENVTPAWVWGGENVGCGADADHLNAMWMGSASHRANALHAGDVVGIGTVYARGCLWATVVYVDT